MGFMSLYSEFGRWYVVETTHGTCIVPFDVAGEIEDVSELDDYCEGEPESFELQEGWCARYSASGYLDCTDWCGPYATEQEALDECRETYGDDDEEDGEDRDNGDP